MLGVGETLGGDDAVYARLNPSKASLDLVAFTKTRRAGGGLASFSMPKPSPMTRIDPSALRPGGVADQDLQGGGGVRAKIWIHRRSCGGDDALNAA